MGRNEYASQEIINRFNDGSMNPHDGIRDHRDGGSYQVNQVLRSVLEIIMFKEDMRDPIDHETDLLRDLFRIVPDALEVAIPGSDKGSIRRREELADTLKRLNIIDS